MQTRCISLLLVLRENGTLEKKERERNDLAEGPRSRTERNVLKKSERPSPSDHIQCAHDMDSYTT